MPPAARSGPVEFGVDSRMSLAWGSLCSPVPCSPLIVERYPPSGRRLVLGRLGVTVVGPGRLGGRVVALGERLLERVGIVLDRRVVLGVEVGGDVVVLLGYGVDAARVGLSGLDLGLRHLAQIAGLGRLVLSHRALRIQRSCTAAPCPS